MSDLDIHSEVPPMEDISKQQEAERPEEENSSEEEASTSNEVTFYQSWLEINWWFRFIAISLVILLMTAATTVLILKATGVHIPALFPAVGILSSNVAFAVFSYTAAICIILINLLHALIPTITRERLSQTWSANLPKWEKWAAFVTILVGVIAFILGIASTLIDFIPFPPPEAFLIGGAALVLLPLVFQLWRVSYIFHQLRTASSDGVSRVDKHEDVVFPDGWIPPIRPETALPETVVGAKGRICQLAGLLSVLSGYDTEDYYNTLIDNITSEQVIKLAKSPLAQNDDVDYLPLDMQQVFRDNRSQPPSPPSTESSRESSTVSLPSLPGLIVEEPSQSQSTTASSLRHQ